MKSGIYLITNATNVKEYTGSSSRLKLRWHEHRYLLRNNKHNNNHLQNAWNKDGESSFTYEILEYCGIEELKDREQWWIELIQCWSHNGKGYNICYPDRHEVSEETKMKIGNAHRGMKRSPETKAKISASHLGKKYPPQSEKTKAKRSAALKGRSKPEGFGTKISTALKGRKFSMEHRTNLSISHLGKEKT